MARIRSSARRSAEPALVGFPLGAGADPNHNSSPEEEPDLISDAPYFAVTDAYLAAGTPEGDRCTTIVRLLEEAGAIISR